MPLTALIRHIDGSASDYTINGHQLGRLDELEKSGLTGKALINAWITDDWGPPPIDISIKGVTSRWQQVNRTLYYD